MATSAVLAAAVLAGNLTACGVVSQSDREYVLQGLEVQCGQVASAFTADGIIAQCNDYSWLIFEQAGVQYTATDLGIGWLEKDEDRIYMDLSRDAYDGHVQGMIVSVGGGIDAPKARYDMRDLSKPKVFYWGDRIEPVQRLIEEKISTDEMKELVAQAEHYQDVIRAELDRLESKK